MLASGCSHEYAYISLSSLDSRQILVPLYLPPTIPTQYIIPLWWLCLLAASFVDRHVNNIEYDIVKAEVVQD